MKKTIYTLNIGDYAPGICGLTYPLMETYAKKIGACFHIIRDRKFQEWPLCYEKLQVYQLAKEHCNDWSILVDSDVLISPAMFDITDRLQKHTVCYIGRLGSGNSFRYDHCFRRDGRHIIVSSWLTVASDWCLDLWRPLDDLTLEQAAANITVTSRIGDSSLRAERLIDDYVLSRNVARFGLKAKTLAEVCKGSDQSETSGQSEIPLLYHKHAISNEQKTDEMLEWLTIPTDGVQSTSVGWGMIGPVAAAEYRRRFDLSGDHKRRAEPVQQSDASESKPRGGIISTSRYPEISGERPLDPREPFYFAKALAQHAHCDLAVSNGELGGVGDVLVFTPLVEEFARRSGRRIRLLTAPFNPVVGVVAGEYDYPIWLNNPFISEIVDARRFGPNAVRTLDLDRDNCCQFSHVIENICLSYGLSSRRNRPSLYLTAEEQARAFDSLKGSRRPLIAVHPSGKTCSPPESPWHQRSWLELINRCHQYADFIQIGKHDFDQVRLGIPMPKTSLREMFAVIWACDAFIGFDSGPMHVAAALERPSLILWDVGRKLLAERGAAPAVTVRWGYPQNRNLMILGERADELVSQAERWIRELCARLS